MKTRRLRLGLVLEFIMCVCISWALSHTAHGGFNVDPAFEGNFLLNIAVCIIAQLVLFYSVLRPPKRLLCHIVYVALAVLACVAAVVFSPSHNPVDDIPQNYFIPVLCLVLVNLLVFELARKHVTCVLLFGVGGLFCGYIQFLYTTNMLLTTVVFLTAAIMLMILRTYMDMVAEVEPESEPLFGKATATGLLFPAAALALAAVVVLGIIMPLNPPHATIKLQTQYLAYEELAVKTGVELDENASETTTSSSIDESLPTRTTTDVKEDDASQQEQEETPDTPLNNKDYLSDDYSDVNLSGALEGLTALALNPAFPWPAVIAGVIAFLILLLLLPRYLVHRLRLRKIEALPPCEQIASLYRFFLSRFKKLGIGKPENLTPIEYANLYRERLCPYVGAQDACTFDHLTALYVWRGYGNQEPSPGDLECMYYLYNSFYANCRKKLGLFKYLFRHMTL